MTPAEEYGFADVVFIGQVKSVEEGTGQDGAERVVSFDAGSSWKKPLTGPVSVRSEGGDCALGFKVGDTWVVYAYEVEGGLYSPAGGNSAPLEPRGPSLDPIKSVNPAAGAGIPQESGQINIIAYVVGAYAIFFVLGGVFYFIARLFRRGH